MKKSSTPTKRKAATVTAPKAKKVTASTIVETVIAPEPVAETAAPDTTVATDDPRYFAPVFNTRISGSPFKFAKPFVPVWLPAARKN
jgi:hypothetical protein